MTRCAFNSFPSDLGRINHYRRKRRSTLPHRLQHSKSSHREADMSTTRTGRLRNIPSFTQPLDHRQSLAAFIKEHNGCSNLGSDMKFTLGPTNERLSTYGYPIHDGH